jgi:hypothetical protein
LKDTEDFPEEDLLLEDEIKVDGSRIGALPKLDTLELGTLLKSSALTKETQKVITLFADFANNLAK